MGHTQKMLGFNSAQKLFCVDYFDNYGSVAVFRVEPSTGHIETSWPVDPFPKTFSVVGEYVIVSTLCELYKYDQNGNLLLTAFIHGIINENDGYQFLPGTMLPGIL